MANILYFAWIRDAIGIDGETVALLPGDSTVAALAQRLAQRGGGYATAFADMGRVRAAIDLEMVTLDAPVAGAAEIAFFPPVTGG
jgi:sulfur-carrier protein